MTTRPTPKLTTVVHTYTYRTDDPNDAAAYDALCVRLRKTQPHWMNCHAPFTAIHSQFSPNDGDEVTLETKCLFDNQWNTETHRVFDWYEGVEIHNTQFKRGYWLEQTADMERVRRETLKCGYCGAHWHAPNLPGDFCTKCLGSEYLKVEDLKLLRLRPASEGLRYEMPELTDSERAALMALYIPAQTTAKGSRAVARKRRTRARVEVKYAKESEAIRDEYEGMVWLLDHDVNTDNVIYYSHTGRFCFGWRTPLSAEVKSALLDVLCEFLHDYDIKAE